MTPNWQRVSELKPGEVYQQGNVEEFIAMTKWEGFRVLYFGDHVFSDLAVSQCELITNANFMVLWGREEESEKSK